MTDQRERFRQLHHQGCFVMPNPWDAGSARMLQQLGFKALATSSAGLAWSLGKADNQVSLEEVLAHLRHIASSVSLPVNADFEGGFAAAPEAVAANVALAAATGIAGLSIEDATGDRENPLYDEGLAADRIRAARRALDDLGGGVMLTARSEGFIRGRPDLAATVRRLSAYAAAGADCLFAPGIRTEEEIRTIVDGVAPKPVNVIAVGNFTAGELAAFGVRRISVGGALARTAWTGFLAAAKEIAEGGSFNRLAAAVPGPELNDAFRR
jgi:methylisocitrate lyase